jgi:hypothetical protein
MWSLPAKVPKQLGVTGTSFFESVGQDGKACVVQGSRRQRTLLVGGLGQLNHGAVVPRPVGRYEADWSKGEWAEDVADQVGLDCKLVSFGVA